MIITIDGPMASGKSTVARTIAKTLEFHHLNSGLLFRALAYLLLTKGGYTTETIADPSLEDLQLYLDPTRLRYQFNYPHAQIFFDEVDITPELKKAVIDNASSLVSANETVRGVVLILLHAIAEHADVVVDGRDTGSVIFPHADIKFYLTASPAVRAQRWIADQKKLGFTVTAQEALEHINTRDTRDKERDISPLVIPDGAVVIDNSDLNLQETVDLFLQHINN